MISFLENYCCMVGHAASFHHFMQLEGTLSGFARTLLGKYLQEDDTVQVYNVHHATRG